MLYFKKKVIFCKIMEVYRMNDIDFFKSFHFNEFSHTRRTHVDNSAGSFLHYVGYIKEGSGLLISASKRLAVTKGDLFYIPRGCRYHSYWANDGQTRLDSLGFQYFPLPEGVHYPLQKLHCDPKIWETFAPLSRDKTVSAVSVGQLYTLLGLLEPTMERSLPEQKDRLTGTALSLMSADLTLSIGQVAAGCGVSEGTLYNTFRRVLGKTPNAVRQELLCQQAVQLLVTTSLSVEEVSRRCGFSSASYFRKVLHRVTGKTPRQLRAEARVL